MKIEEANKVVAEFMGKKWSEGTVRPWWEDYSKSLDALVPVWEKLELIDFKWDWLHKDQRGVFTIEHPNIVSGKGDTIQQAAAIATAKCILELEDRE